MNIRRHIQPERPETLESWKWYQYINRAWMKYLSPSEFMLVLFILDRTLGWRKESEVITRRHMLKGVLSNGTAYHHGTSLGASTIDTTLNRLVEKEVIERRTLMRGTTRYVLLSINFEWEPSELPRRLKSARKKRSRRLYNLTPKNGIAYPKNGDR